MSGSARVWTESFRVRSYETDPGGSASIPSLCNYLQEAAGVHATDLGVAIEQLQQDNLTWVLGKLRVEVGAYPAWRDEVTVETWPSDVDRLYAYRDFLVRTNSEELLARGKSAWLLIDLEKRKPVRIPEVVSRLELPDRDPALEELPSKLPDVSDAPVGYRTVVGYRDLDVNGHVNNVRYAEWSLESLAFDLLQSYSAASIDLHFRSEANYGDAVAVQSMELDATPSERLTWGHVLMSGERELARARTVWKPR